MSEALEKAFHSLSEQDEIKRYLLRAIGDIQENVFCGIPLSTRLIPKEYIQRYHLTNLWKYDLPNGWRLLYSVTTPTQVEIVAVILGWFDHKNYERLMGY